MEASRGRPSPIRSRKAAASLPHPAVSQTLARRAARPLLAFAVAASLGGCMTDRDTTGSIGVAALPTSQAGLRDYAETWRRKHAADPGNETAAINYARALRARRTVA